MPPPLTYAQLLANSNNNNNNENDTNWINNLNLQELNNTRSNQQKSRNRMKELINTGGGLTQSRLRKKQAFSPLKVNMYNATSTSSKKMTGSALYDLAKSFTDFGSHIADGGRYKMKVAKLRGIHRNFETAFEVSNEYGFIETVKTKNISGIDFVVNVTDRSGTVTKTTNATLFRTGKVRMSGGYVNGSTTDVNIDGQPEETRKVLQRLIGDGARITSPMKFNNITGVFKFKYGVQLVQGRDFLVIPARLGPNYKVRTVYEPELHDVLNLTVTKPEPKFTLLVFTKLKQVGEVMGLKSASQVRKAFETAKHIFSTIVPISPAAVAKSLNLTNTTEHRTRVTNRLNNMPAPELVKGRGTTCPKPRRPDPLSFQGKCPQGDTHYVKPNPQGQPCCYKKPKTTNFSKKKVAEAYKKANVRVPQGVRNFFGVPPPAANAAKKNNIAVTRLTKNTIQTHVDPKVGFKIGTRQCTRYSKEALIDIAKRLAIPGVTSGVSKINLCEMIKARTINIGANRTNNHNRTITAVQFTNTNGTVMPVTGNTVNKVKVGRRFCKTYLKKDLLRFALKLRIQGVSDALKKDEICAKIYQHAETVRARKRVNHNQKVANEADVVEQRRVNAMARRVAGEQAEKNKAVANRERNEEAKTNAEWTRLGLNANNLGVYFKNFNGNFNGNDVRSLINQTYTGLRNLPTSSRSEFPRLSDIQKLKKQLAKALYNKKINNFAKELEAGMRDEAVRPVVAPPPANRFVRRNNVNVEEI